MKVAFHAECTEWLAGYAGASPVAFILGVWDFVFLAELNYGECYGTRTLDLPCR